MKINKDMADHLIRWNTEYDHCKYNKSEIRDLFVLIKYLKEELEDMRSKMNESRDNS